MKCLTLILIALITPIISASAFEETYLRAQNAYDNGNYAEAVVLYQDLIRDGLTNMELHYNLANAAFKDGDLPLAVRHYRLAWYQAPRDPDIQANLHFALNAAGAIEPTSSLQERFLKSLSNDEWSAMALGSYLLLALILTLSLLIRTASPVLLKLSLLPTALLILSFAGIRGWSRLERSPEWVVVKAEATALHSPINGSAAYYKIPQGALVQQKRTDPKGWVEVQYDKRSGWLKADDYIQRLSP
ncbi:MAG TPA: tetratricopeptide repeat protein [Pontiella sp.]